MTRQGAQALAVRADRFGRALETALLVGVLGAMILIAAAQIALRNFWNSGFDWADEALRIMVLWVTMLGAVAASREGRQVRIDALSRYLPSAAIRWTHVLVDAFAAIVCFVLAWHSYQFVADSFAAGDRVLAGEFPAWGVQLILPVGFALIGYRYTVACLRPGPGIGEVVLH